MELYMETSALLAWLFSEPAAEAVMQRVKSADAVVSSSLTILEASRAILRAKSQGSINAREGAQLEFLMRSAFSRWGLLEITPAIMERAGMQFPSEPIRTLDAIHLATVLEFARRFPGIQILSFDQRIRENAMLLGFPVLG